MSSLNVTKLYRGGENNRNTLQHNTIDTNLRMFKTISVENRGFILVICPNEAFVLKYYLEDVQERNLCESFFKRCVI